MAARAAARADQPEGDWVRHGCWLVALTIGVAALLILVVGTFGLIGPVELVGIVVVAAVAVVGRDLAVRRRARRRRAG